MLEPVTVRRHYFLFDATHGQDEALQRDLARHCEVTLDALAGEERDEGDGDRDAS